jgi:hypothetical protein
MSEIILSPFATSPIPRESSKERRKKIQASPRLRNINDDSTSPCSLLYQGRPPSDPPSSPRPHHPIRYTAPLCSSSLPLTTSSHSRPSPLCIAEPPNAHARPMKTSSTKMNFFAKRPKTPAELVKAVRDMLAPGGRLDGSPGGLDGRKKVRTLAYPFPWRLVYGRRAYPKGRMGDREELSRAKRRRKGGKAIRRLVCEAAADGCSRLSYTRATLMAHASLAFPISLRYQANEELSKLLTQIKQLLYGDSGSSPSLLKPLSPFLLLFFHHVLSSPHGTGTIELIHLLRLYLILVPQKPTPRPKR